MLRLISPTLTRIKSYLDFIREMQGLGEKIWEGHLPKSGQSNEAFVQHLLGKETQAAAGLVTETIYWAILDQQVVGRIALRHELTPALEEFGGHIGYEVRPSMRRRGIATEMLKLLLETPKAKTIGQVLVTCAPDNIASNKTILTNGGVLSKTAFVASQARDTNYYWIQTQP